MPLLETCFPDSYLQLKQTTPLTQSLRLHFLGHGFVTRELIKKLKSSLHIQSAD